MVSSGGIVDEIPLEDGVGERQSCGDEVTPPSIAELWMATTSLSLYYIQNLKIEVSIS